jgi:lipopolysaccharide transport protein LptA
MAAGRVSGNEMIFLQDKRQATFTGAVQTQLKPQSKPEPAATPQKRAAGPLGQRTLGAGNAPVDVTSDKLFVDDNRKAAIFSGNVAARQGDANLSAGELEAHYEGQPVALGGAVAPAQPAPSGAPQSGGKLKRLIARDNVVMTQGTDRVTSAVGEFDAVDETAVLTGGVVMTSTPDRRAQSDRAELDQRADTVLLVGNVDVTQGSNILRGRRLSVDRKSGKLKLSAPPEDGQPAGRIFTRFIQAEQPAAKKKVPTKAEAQKSQPSPLAFNSDPTQPTDIEAATLDADDTAKTAIYRGQVRARQGDNTIQTEELIAYYTGSAAAGMAATQPASAAPQAAKSKTELTRVISKSKLTVTSANDQSATGDQGDFDIKANRIVVTGNVTLRQGKNITHGPKAIIDLTTGQYQMEGAAPAPWRSTTPPGTAPGLLPELDVEQPTPSPRVTDPERQCPVGRSCAVFHPNDVKSIERKKDKAGAEPAAAAQKQPRVRAPTGGTTSSWDATTSQSSRQ